MGARLARRLTRQLTTGAATLILVLAASPALTVSQALADRVHISLPRQASGAIAPAAPKLAVDTPAPIETPAPESTPNAAPQPAPEAVPATNAAAPEPETATAPPAPSDAAAEAPSAPATGAEAQPPAPTGPEPDASVDISEGVLGGQAVGDGTFVFKAVPFAEPPVGDLRWAPPQAPERWDGVRFETASAPACMQASYGWNDALAKDSSEDCLYLEIRTPSLKARSKLPVMVFIHGGSNRAGAGSGTVELDLGGKGVVLVSLQYRLGVFGFMSHPALTAESPDHASGNYGLMDQIQALQWVKDNIEAFGGDADNVTVFGHSAGAEDIGLLLTSPLAKGLFQKVIEESGPPGFGIAPRTLAQNEALGVTLAKRLSGATPDSAQALADLRHAPALGLQEAADKIKPPISDPSFVWLQAVIDGHVLPTSPKDVFYNLKQANVPVIIGVSARELDLDGGDKAVYPTIYKAFGAQRMKAVRFYRLDVNKKVKPDPVLGEVSMQVSTDLMMRCPSDWTAWHVAAMGQKAWLYQLDVDSGDGPVHHGSELPYVFDSPKTKKAGDWPPMQAYWLNFARTGNPNGKTLTKWEDYGKDGHYIEFTDHGPEDKQAMRLEICKLRETP